MIEAKGSRTCDTPFANHVFEEYGVEYPVRDLAVTVHGVMAG